METPTSTVHDYSVIEQADMHLGHSSSGLLLPGIDPATRLEASRLCARDVLENHVFFNERQFHNHLIHHLLATFSMGASAERLQQIFDVNKPMQRPSVDCSDKVIITADNIWDHLSQEEYYPGYVAFFKAELAGAGDEWKSVATRYFLDPRALSMTMSGLFHPLILFGYGLEFESRVITAMALAQGFVHRVAFNSILVPETFKEICSNSAAPNMAEKGASLWKIIRAMRVDPLASKLSFDDTPYSLTNSTIPEDLAIKYAKMWHVEATETSVNKKYAELLSVIAHIYGSVSRPGYAMVFEFAIMHLLTSVYFLPIIFDALTVDQQAVLLHAHSVQVLVLFAAVGCPELYFTAKEPADVVASLEACSLEDKQTNPWFAVFEKAIASNDMHVAKVVRALWRGSIISAFAEDMPETDSYELPPPVNWLRIAQDTVDIITASSFEDKEKQIQEGKRTWVRGMIAFDEFWSKYGEKI
ncbi:hypothetical protein IWW45_001946 [Coemansia sp. RSA 485]|nr:hypothetical protein IWW45_001946 [Coemansia sp. RSA 485]